MGCAMQPCFISKMKILKEIRANLRAEKKEHGSKNPLVTHYYFLWLTYRLHEWNIGNRQWRRSVGLLLKKYAYLHYGKDQLFAVDANTKSESRSYSYSFPKDYFFKNYETFIVRHKPYISSKLAFSVDHRYLFNRFIFVIGENHEWFYYTKPFSTLESLVGNRNIERYPYHPLLSVDLGLTVSVAGEVSFLWNDKEEYPSLVIVTNWSGHFLPVDWSAIDLNISVRKSLNLPDCSTIFSVANDGVGISGPTIEFLYECPLVTIK